MSEHDKTENSEELAGRIDSIVMRVEVDYLYSLKRSIDIMTEENFGFCPNNNKFDAIDAKWREQESLVKSLYPGEYEKYINVVYA